MARFAIHKGIDGIHGVERRVPTLRALLLQEPALHFLDGLLVIGLQQADGLDGGHFGRNLVVEPAVERLARVEIAPHFFGIDAVFANALQVFLRLLRVAVFGEDDGRVRLAIDGEVARLLGQQVHEIGSCLGHVFAELTTVDRGQIEPVDGGFARTQVFHALFLGLFHLFDLFLHLATHVAMGIFEQVFRVRLRANHRVQAHEHLAHGHRHIERAGHFGPPAPRAVGVLQFLQLREVVFKAIIDAI